VDVPAQTQEEVLRRRPALDPSHPGERLRMGVAAAIAFRPGKRLERE
jgi:hypothetical protein